MSQSHSLTLIDRAWQILPEIRRALLVVEALSGKTTALGDLPLRISGLREEFHAAGQKELTDPLVRLESLFATTDSTEKLLSPEELDSGMTDLNQFGDVLLELDATGVLSDVGPSHVNEDRQTVVIETPDPIAAAHSSSERPPHLTHLAAIADITRRGETLVGATTNLLDRMQNDADCLYFGPMSRIHHLAVTLRDSWQDYLGSDMTPEVKTVDSPFVITPDAFDGLSKSPRFNSALCRDDTGMRNRFTVPDVSQSVPQVTSLTVVDWDAELSTLALTKESVEESISAMESSSTMTTTETAIPILPLTAGTIVSEAVLPLTMLSGGRCGASPHQAIIVDKSPFFRLLLISAINSVGHRATAYGSLEEWEAAMSWDSTVTITSGDILIWGYSPDNSQSTRLMDLIQSQDHEQGKLLIQLIDRDEDRTAVQMPFDHCLRRKQVPDLVKLVKEHLGQPTSPMAAGA